MTTWGYSPGQGMIRTDVPFKGYIVPGTIQHGHGYGYGRGPESLIGLAVGLGVGVGVPLIQQGMQYAFAPSHPQGGPGQQQQMQPVMGNPSSDLGQLVQDVAAAAKGDATGVARVAQWQQSHAGQMVTLPRNEFYPTGMLGKDNKPAMVGFRGEQLNAESVVQMIRGQVNAQGIGAAQGAAPVAGAGAGQGAAGAAGQGAPAPAAGGAQAPAAGNVTLTKEVQAYLEKLGQSTGAKNHNIGTAVAADVPIPADKMDGIDGPKTQEATKRTRIALGMDPAGGITDDFKQKLSEALADPAKTQDLKTKLQAAAAAGAAAGAGVAGGAGGAPGGPAGGAPAVPQGRPAPAAGR